MLYLKSFGWVALALGVCVTAIALPQDTHTSSVSSEGIVVDALKHAMTVSDYGSPMPFRFTGQASLSSNIAAHEGLSSTFFATANGKVAAIIPTPVPNIVSTAAYSINQLPAEAVEKAYGASCFTVTLSTSDATFASRSPIDIRYTRRDDFPNGADVVGREPQTTSILAWCIGGAEEEDKILSNGRKAGTEHAKPTVVSRTFARPNEAEPSLV
ncbi:hypothetical protein KC316_g3799 [Hortaea werneckii]|nr:hypothetical protein KC324_g3808 [Hortaea werneckii]KAI7589682.1 hypothetical protein KC316_g3799 [Hortaea werneckii]